MTQLFNITHESGDLSEYDSTDTDGGDLSVTAAAALAGTNYGLQFVINDTATLLAAKNVNQSNLLRYRFYFDPNNLTIPTGTTYRFILSNIKPTAGYALILEIYWDGNTYKVRINVVTDSDSYVPSSYVSLSNAPHSLEIELNRATTSSSNNGSAELYIDGSLAATVTGIDNYSRMSTSAEIQFKVTPVSGTSGTFYIDEIVANNDGSEIGPVSSPSGIVIFRRRLQGDC